MHKHKQAYGSMFIPTQKTENRKEKNLWKHQQWKIAFCWGECYFMANIWEHKKYAMIYHLKFSCAHSSKLNKTSKKEVEKYQEVWENASLRIPNNDKPNLNLPTSVDVDVLICLFGCCHRRRRRRCCYCSCCFETGETTKNVVR